MKKSLAMLLLGLGLFAVSVPAQAAAGSAVLEEQYKSALNRIVQEVRQAPGPAEKRAVLGHFVTGMRDGLQRAEGMASPQSQDRAALQILSGKFSGYAAELDGMGGYVRVADADLDAYAGFIQQSMEQAPLGGGVYLSGTALIIILLLLIFLL
ncbi:MAG: hypothetical protein ABIW76_04070 [Fibrobacteria bacterium]